MHLATLTRWRKTRIAACATLMCAAPAAAPQPAAPAAPKVTADTSAYVQWLAERSMLHQTALLAQRYSGNSSQWQHPYGLSQPQAAVQRASVWFTAYPASTIAAAPGTSVLATLADERLWRALQAIGVQAIHTGPIKRSGGLSGRDYTPSIDGNFDRISLDIDPAFGTQAQYQSLVTAARSHGAIVIGDIIPGHTGKGADFRLAERAYADYPGLYHMVSIPPADWALLPQVAPGKDAVNLSPAVVDQLQAKRYIVGNLHSGIFYAPGIKDSDWSATDVVRGVDGVSRRWVYLHYFKQGQPTLNWLDPSMAAQRLVLGDALHELSVLGVGMLRLDANALLGIERDPNGKVWWAGHPLSLTSNQLIASMVRKFGGFSFEELAAPLDVMREEWRAGPDLSYDFVTRPAYDHALLTGDAGFLRLIFQLMRREDIDPGRLIHALQNHDELTLGLAHFAAHSGETFTLHGAPLTGGALRDQVQRQIYARLIGEQAPYNLKFGNGVASTTATVAAATLGIRDVQHLKPMQVEQIKKLHLLLAFYNAMQPGVFALSGWDLVGALTLPPATVRERLADGDTRWINRGGYDLIGSNPRATTSVVGMPRAVALYGALPEQLKRRDSFAASLARVLRARSALRLYAARLIDVPDVQARGLLVLVNALPQDTGTEVTAINFSAHPVDESVAVSGAAAGAQVADVMAPEAPQTAAGAGGTLRLRLGAYDYKAFKISR